ncbi:MAG: hypothetical protein ABW211_02770, partial [Acidimicrobiia bacterium]
MTSTLAASVFERLGSDLWLLIPAFFFSFAAAALVGRVLGVRRSFLATLLTGLIGWLVGLLVALAVAGDHPDATENFARNLFLFALFGAMAAAVWLEFLARPGMIARAQTGMQSVPHPLRSVRLRSRQGRPSAEITRIAMRTGLAPSLGLGRSARTGDGGVRPPTVRRLRLALEECGGMFVKLGQVLSTRSDLLPHEYVTALSHLQRDVAPAPWADVLAMLESEFGAPLDEVF